MDLLLKVYKITVHEIKLIAIKRNRLLSLLRCSRTSLFSSCANDPPFYGERGGSHELQVTQKGEAINLFPLIWTLIAFIDR